MALISPKPRACQNEDEGWIMEQSAPKRSRLPIFLVPTILLFAAMGAFLWVIDNRIDDLRAQLSHVEQRAASIERDVIQKSNQVNSLQGQLIATQQQALRAEHRSDELEATNRESQAQVQHLRQESAASAEAAAQASKETQDALASRQKAVGELDSMRQRRAAELDRMQQALSLIVPTARTPTGMVMQLADKSFRFDFDSATLKPENRETLSRIAGVLLASEGYRLFIDGHTDDIGTDQYNQGLSERRAGSVRDYLVKAGVPADIIEVKGFGKSNPLVQGKSNDAREKNRRVQIGIVDTIINYQTDDLATKQSKPSGR
jgi:outer membrane protein OmpA-like peptidoglycan-associated protein